MILEENEFLINKKADIKIDIMALVVVYLI